MSVTRSGKSEIEVRRIVLEQIESLKRKDESIPWDVVSVLIIRYLSEKVDEKTTFVPLEPIYASVLLGVIAGGEGSELKVGASKIRDDKVLMTKVLDHAERIGNVVVYHR